ncbi:MAG: PQQ-binding-like beta-propeller repeat protein [Pseudomonadota bacterium]|nr:PQQ-binding-like beta-propeller repeat protein [Pseudomonadota bacterium]
MQGTITLRITAALIGLLGLTMLWQGLELALVGGTPYYAVAALLMSASAVQLLRLKRSGFYLFATTLLITLGWATYEAGTEFWLVGSRIWIVGLISLWLCLPINRRPLWQGETTPLLKDRLVQVCAIASAAVLIAMTINLFNDPILDLPDQTYGAPQNEDTWSAYGGNAAGTRYAPHDQINLSNVNQLEKAWQADTRRIGQFSATPIQIDDALYLCTSQNVILSLDGDTGEERWRFDPENRTPPWGILGNCRGVTYYHIPERAKGEMCAERIFTATTDARLIAVDKTTGQACSEFGSDGQISLLAGMGEVKEFYYMVTSPPTMASGALVVGGFVLDNQETEEPSGVVRGYDPRTGSLLWAWDIGREGQTDIPAEGGYYTRGTPNVWSLMSADDDLGLVYVPTGNATPDYFGGHRTEIMDKFASSIVAIDARTGLTRWHFQTAHHDIWDYDVPSQPTLVDLTIDGARRKAVIMPTKRAEIFVLDRETGEVIFDVTERTVPQSDLLNERSSPTQPFSTGMPSFAYPTIDERDMFGITPFDQMACRITFKGLRWEGTMTPPAVEGALLYPGPAGGMNWGGVAVDEQRQLMVVNNMQLPFTIHMIPREEDRPTSEEGGFASGYGVGGPQRGTPYAARVDLFASPLSLPCLRPPYGEIAVVDLTTQQIVWRRGTGLLNLGFPSRGGSVITKGGLIFNAGFSDGAFRAIDASTGQVVWNETIQTPSQATPMTYTSPTTGRQYVLMTTPSAEGPSEEITDFRDLATSGKTDGPGGAVIAYALPE